ncbi:MAG: hypothetical protein QNK37_26675 [Acidobacteriota bacterium]|nr:hypothetical protein [Acidobacteriota bacterium]
MDGITGPDLTLIPAFSAFPNREAAARIAAEDKTANKIGEPRDDARLFTRSREQVRRFPGFDEITEINELVKEDGGRTEVQRTEILVTREPLNEAGAFNEPGRLLDLLA